MGIQPSPLPKAVEWKFDANDQAFIMVTGSREFDDLKAVNDTLVAYHEAFAAKFPDKDLVLLSGHAQRGADVLAEMVWGDYGPVFTEPAEWDVHTPERCKCHNDPNAEYCRLAGIVRNEKMVDEHPVSVVAAFYNPTAANNGTNHAAEYARSQGIPVRTVVQQERPTDRAITGNVTSDDASVTSEPAASDSTAAFLAAST